MTELVGEGVFFFAMPFGFYRIFNHADVTFVPQMFYANHILLS